MRPTHIVHNAARTLKHKCTRCGRPIERGQDYTRHSHTVRGERIPEVRHWRCPPKPADIQPLPNGEPC